MINIAVFASGNGSNFQAIVEENINVCVVICNNKDAYVVERARALNIPCHVISSESEIILVLKNYVIDLIVLAGYMKILSPNFINWYPNKIVNIHPSLLPNYKGMNALKKAYDNNEKTVGVTVHYVDEYVDNGVIIAQEELNVNDLTFEQLEEEIHKIEHKLYPRVIKTIVKEWLDEKSTNISK